MLKYFACIVAVAFVFAFPAGALAQDEEEIDFNSGTVKEVRTNSNEIVVSEYDWDTDTDIDITYVVAPDARVENADSWGNIAGGSYVDFEFIEKDGKKTITYISVYDAENDYEEAAE